MRLIYQDFLVKGKSCTGIANYLNKLHVPNKNNSSGVRGVHYDKTRKLWVAQIMFQRKAHLIGRFKTKREAVRARLTGEEEYYGKYR